MIKILFKKYLLTCDFPGTTPCQKYLHFKNADEANKAITENRWVQLSVTKNGQPEKIIFICNHCQSKVSAMTKAQYEQMRETAYTVMK